MAYHAPKIAYNLPCNGHFSTQLLTSTQPRIKISVNTDISVIGFYGNIGKISVDIFTKILVIKIFHILII